MIGKIPVSVYVLTFNNRRTIERCLRSVAWAEELVIVDSFSTDGTYEICQRYTGRTYQRKWTGHRDQYQYAADLTTQDWIMFVDADEEIPPELAKEIREELKGGAEGIDAFFVYRRTYYLGRWIRYGGWYPDGEIRLYRREKGRWEGGLHAKIFVNGEGQIPQEPVSPLYLPEYLRPDPDDRQILSDCSGGHGARGKTVQPLQTPFSSSVSMFQGIYPQSRISGRFPRSGHHRLDDVLCVYQICQAVGVDSGGQERAGRKRMKIDGRRTEREESACHGRVGVHRVESLCPPG